MKRYSLKDDDTTHLTGDQEGFEENNPHRPTIPWKADFVFVAGFGRLRIEGRDVD